MPIWECYWLVGLTSEYANLVLFSQQLVPIPSYRSSSPGKQAQQHTGKRHFVSLPKDNLTLEFIKKFF